MSQCFEFLRKSFFYKLFFRRTKGIPLIEGIKINIKDFSLYNEENVFAVANIVDSFTLLSTIKVIILCELSTKKLAIKCVPKP